MLRVPNANWNQTGLSYPRDSCIADLFEQQAARTPEAVAVAAKDNHLTYRELDERSNRLARHLKNLGVGPGSLVGIAMERSEFLVVGMLGILKAGGAYVPLDPSHPRERLALIIEDSGLRVLLTAPHTSSSLPVESNGLNLVRVDDPVTDGYSSQPVSSRRESCNAAYLIYTSGSTGKPKGVVVENRNAVSFFFAMDRAIGCEPGVWLAVTSITFDISILELLWTLTRGFKVVVHGDKGPASIADEIAQQAVTHMQMTPSLAYMLTLDRRAFAALSGLKQLLLGGEPLPASLVRRIRSVYGGEIHNMYGPTETTIWSATHRIDDLDSTVPIGRPIANTRIYLLDDALQPVPEGEAGELFIGGDGVARGYWNRPELTAERFAVIPSVDPERLYRTGDLARYLPDGTIEFLGRADDQIKLRGHRIEPGEIESLLEKHEGVSRAVVVAREDREGDKRLIAYLQAEETGPEMIRALRVMLESSLPDYMIPSAIVFLDAVPLTANGKIDRKALLAFPLPGEQTCTTATLQDGSGDPMVDVVVRAWQDALGRSSVNIDDNFFDLGAHSLTVAEVHGRLQEELHCEIPLVDLFQFPTVSALARHLSGVPAPPSDSKRTQRRRQARQL